MNSIKPLFAHCFFSDKRVEDATARIKTGEETLVFHSLFMFFIVISWIGWPAFPGTAQSRKISAQASGAGVNYYVSTAGSDSNDGSASHPFLSIQQAAKVVVPGTTVHVAPGVYSGGVKTTVSGTLAARIRFVSDEKWGAKLLADGMSGVWLNHGDYVDIEGFEISGKSDQGILNYGSYVRVLSNYVHDIVIECASSGSGIDHANYSASNNETVGNLVEHIGPAAGCESDHGPGIYHANLRGTIANNTVSFGREGIHLWHAANAVSISGNVVIHNRRSGILIGAGDAPGGVTADNCIVSHNTSAYNKYGIREFGNTGRNNKYIDNNVYANSESDWLLQSGLSE